MSLYSRGRSFVRSALVAAGVAALIGGFAPPVLAGLTPLIVAPPAEAGLPELTYPAYYGPLEKARAQVFAGRYRLAVITLATLRPTDDATRIEAPLLRAEALAALGRRDQAIEQLAAPPVADDPRAVVLHARILADQGRFAPAVELLQSAVQRRPDGLVERYELAHTLDRAGDLEAATAAYAWFTEPPHDFRARLAAEDDPTIESAEHVTLAARAIDRWATLTNAYQTDESLHNTLLNAFVRAYDQIDRGYWPARVAAGEYWLSHDNPRKALEELGAAVQANPNDARLNELLGLIALDQFNFASADAAVAALRRVDPNSVRADLLEARTLLASRQPLQAEAPLRRALQRQPRNITALGLLAAANALRLRDEAAGELLRQVDAIDPDDATARFEVAEQLGAMRQYPRAIEMYQQAIARAPWWTAPRNGLGLLYTQSGDEDDARATLDAAHALDPFNLRTTNYLRLLDDLAGYDRLETEHFIIRYNARLDPIIAEPMAEFLERVHAEVTAEYRHEPAVKSIIEIFPTHDAFSVRTTGSPWIGTVGASTGRVIALVSPRRGQATMGAYNWANVLRHEYTHTVTLSATENRIPHWMTEGLAVLEERKPLPWDWVPLLFHAVKNDGLFTLEDLTWGFVRPKKPSDRQLAYAQSYWVCKYVQDTFGHETILRMLAMYRDGKLQEEVFPATTGQSLSQFEQNFFAWTRAQVAGWGYDPASQKKYDALRAKGEDLIKARQYAEAVKVWQEIAQLRPVDALPHQRLAGLFLTREVNSPLQAVEHLKRLHEVEQNDNRYAKRVSRVYRDLKQFAPAVQYAREATMIDPYDLDAQQALLDLLEQSGDADGAARQRVVVEKLTTWHAENRARNNPQGP